MLESIGTIVAALVPIFVLIALGHVLYRFRFPGESFWPQLERLVYYVFLPALLVEKLGSAPLDPARIAPVALAVVLTLAAISVVVLMLRRAMPVDGPAFTSVYQGAIRFNTYLGLAVAMAVYGAVGVATAALALAFFIPLVNVLSVAVLTRYAGSQASARTVLLGIVKNPLIIACVIGIVLNGSGVGLPFDGSVLNIIGRAALPLGLMTVGAGLRLKMDWGQGAAIAWSSVFKLVAMPLLAFAAARLVGLTTLEMQMLVLFAALPTATSAYILARLLGGDHTLVASILTVQTLLSVVTLSVTLLLIGT